MCAMSVPLAPRTAHTTHINSLPALERVFGPLHGPGSERTRFFYMLLNNHEDGAATRTYERDVRESMYRLYGFTAGVTQHFEPAAGLDVLYMW